MGRGRETDRDQTGVRVPKARNRTAPVLFVPELPLPFPGHLRPVPDETGASGAAYHLPVDELERIGHEEGESA